MVESEGYELQNKDHRVKDMDLVNKMAFMSGLLEVQSPGAVVPDTSGGNSERMKEQDMPHNPESGRIVMKQFIKM
eukprot:CAMPEP_0116934760 /NCGR_PEP_ID=MMETSP0467-20121206/29862_1 /TAXON_ID=283647 /ORGANISM="Mesodinium pulex, Strain SPMC105" /LENGTH=74 /DNA_ID=CAMNT_0004615969 /DNA_START=1130 /DNA_END=1354 /DNA_ORIENTATION=+